MLLGSALPACSQTQDKPRHTGGDQTRQEDLRSSYAGLAKTLSSQGGLSTLKLWKVVTLDAPNDAIKQLMTKLSDTGEKRAGELEELRTLKPNVEGDAKQKSPIGKALGEIAMEEGAQDMLSREGGFDVRFVLLQTQSTGAVSYLAKAAAEFEPNEKRKAWLQEVSKEYAALREDLVKYLENDGCK